MEDLIWILYIIEMMAGLVVVSYSNVAVENGFPTGRWYMGPGVPPAKFFGYLIVSHATLAPLFTLDAGWLLLIASFWLGFGFRKLLIQWLEHWSQIYAPIIAILAGVTASVLQAIR